jgi:hypothetical protein
MFVELETGGFGKFGLNKFQKWQAIWVSVGYQLEGDTFLKLKGVYFENALLKALPNVQTYQKFIFILFHDTYQVLQENMKKKMAIWKRKMFA